MSFRKLNAVVNIHVDNNLDVKPKVGNETVQRIIYFAFHPTLH